MSLKRLVTAKHEKLSTAEIRIKKKREDVEQYKHTVFEYGWVDVSAWCYFTSSLRAAEVRVWYKCVARQREENERCGVALCEDQ